MELDCICGSVITDHDAITGICASGRGCGCYGYRPSAGVDYLIGQLAEAFNFSGLTAEQATLISAAKMIATAASRREAEFEAAR